MTPRKPKPAREAVRLLIDQGITDRFEVARLLGIHPEYARTLLRDPSDEAAIRRNVKLRDTAAPSARATIAPPRSAPTTSPAARRDAS